MYIDTNQSYINLHRGAHGIHFVKIHPNHQKLSDITRASESPNVALEEAVVAPPAPVLTRKPRLGASRVRTSSLVFINAYRTTINWDISPITVVMCVCICIYIYIFTYLYPSIIAIYPEGANQTCFTWENLAQNGAFQLNDRTDRLVMIVTKDGS